MIQLDADRALQRCFAPRSVATLTCLFPEPWPRERHAKHRLFSERALACCASRLVDDGELRIVTDHAPYAEWIVAHVPACFTLERGRVGPEHGTWFERTWTAKGQRDFEELRLHKHAHPDVAILEDHPMETHRCDAFDAGRFAPVVVEHVDAGLSEARVDVVRAGGDLWIRYVPRHERGR